MVLRRHAVLEARYGKAVLEELFQKTREYNVATTTLIYSSSPSFPQVLTFILVCLILLSKVTKYL